MHDRRQSGMPQHLHAIHHHNHGLCITIQPKVPPLRASPFGAKYAYSTSHTRSTVLCVVHSTVLRVITRMPWDVQATLARCLHMVYHVPTPRSMVLRRLHR